MAHDLLKRGLPSGPERPEGERTPEGMGMAVLDAGLLLESPAEQEQAVRHQAFLGRG